LRLCRLEKSRSQRIVWLLEELKVPYKLKLYHRGKDFLADPGLKKIHPLGKSPVIGIKTPGAENETILAESGAIVEYLVEYFGKWMEPKRYNEGMEGQIGGETEEWKRNRYFMHYAEGSLMTIMLVAYIINSEYSSKKSANTSSRVCVAQKVCDL
jgi:glutathione S-transferase